MKSIEAIYENGVFRPLEPVNLPERTHVWFEPRQMEGTESDDGLDDVYEILSRRYRSGHRDTAERHDEHQP